MKALAAVVVCALVAGCQSAPSAPSAPRPHTNFKYGMGDGETMATAVEIRTRSETEGGRLIRDWLKANYPGYVIQEQELIEARNKAYNLITVVGPGNTAHRVYFDISQYYRRLDDGAFPRAPM